MRDTYNAADLTTEMTETRALSAPQPGMRHSIRPRRSMATRPTYDVKTITPREARDDETSVSDTALETFEDRYVMDPDLPHWNDLAMTEAGSRRASRTALPVVDAARDSTTVRAFDLLRTRLRQTTQEHGWVNIAVTAPTTGCGNTFTAVNLALSLSRVSGSRTVLMDFDLRSPGVAQAFDVTPRGSMQDFLAGYTPMGDHMVKVSETLALGLNNSADQNASETLQAAETSHTLERMRAALQPELVIYDMPAMLAYDDVSAFLPHLDGVLLVSDGSQTTGRELLECERMLEGQVPLLGVVLNRARSNSIPRYA